MLYLDNAATTYPYFSEEKYQKNYWWNSNSQYNPAIQTHIVLDEARERIKKIFGVKTGKVIFCRSASEAADFLIGKFIDKNFDMVIPSYEHDSLFARPYIYDYIVPKQRKDNTVVFNQYINQLTGKVMFTIRKPLDDTNVFYCSDFTAAIGHIDFPKDLDCYLDAFWGSAHKFYGPKGIGFLWLSNRLCEFLRASNDSKNEYGLIHGTVNVPAVLAMVDALEHSKPTQEEIDRAWKCWDYISDELTRNNIEHIIPNIRELYTPFIGLLTLEDVNADALVQYLASKEIYVSAAHSACSDNSDYRVAKALGYNEKQARQSIRISLEKKLNPEELEPLIQEIKNFIGKFVV